MPPTSPQFQKLALAAIEDIASRGKLAIMVGGTGLYIDSMIYNYSFLPASDASERTKLNNLTLAELVQVASERGLPLATIDARNKRRVIRLIENDGQSPTKSRLRSNSLVLGLSIPRDELEARITSRVDEMLASGLEREVEALAKRYGWKAEPMKGVGYREWQNCFEGEQTLALTRSRIIAASLQLAKKQRTWFKRNKSIHWLAERSKLAEADELVTTFLNK